MKKDLLKKAGIAALSTALISGALLFPSLSSANDEMYKLNNKVSVYMNAYDAKNRKNAAGRFGAGEYYVYRKFGNYINISDTPGEPGGWINPSDNEENKKVNSNSKSKAKEVKTSTTEFLQLSGDMITINVNTPIYISAADAKNSVDQRGTFFPGRYYIYREYDGAFNITREKGVPGGWIYFDSSIKNELKISNELPKISESIEGAKETLKVISGEKTKEVVNNVDQNKFTLDRKVSGFMTAYNASNSLNAVNTVYPGEYYIYTRYNGMINVTTDKDVPGSWINPNHTKAVETKVVKEEKKKEDTNKETKKESVAEIKEEQKVEEIKEDVKETAAEVKKEKKQEKSKDDEKKEVVEEVSEYNSYDVIGFARQYVGYNYVFGGISPSTGFDCSGFTSYVFRNTRGIVLSRGAQGQFYGGQSVSMDNLQAGDLVFFGNSVNDIYHVGIYDGNGNVIHASTEDTGVIVSNFYSSWYQNNYVGARRY
ncbi:MULTISPECIES: C40 family peptidase [Helcococcus]|uniref:C40 family peptidase n=1 Tax=Helcococcus bovis TaxID=3153252 RepID=A0ABW9F566_9FIRM